MKDIKTKCLKSPKKKLWVGPTAKIAEMHAIFNHIDKLAYEDKPDYHYIKKQLLQIYNNYDIYPIPAQHTNAAGSIGN